MILQDINNPSLATPTKSLYQKLLSFCKDKPIAVSEIRSDSQKHHIVEYRAQFAKEVYPDSKYTYAEIGRLLNRAPQTVRFWLTDRTPIQ